MAAAALVLAACSKPVFTKDHDGRTVTVEKGSRFFVELEPPEPGARFARHPHVDAPAVRFLGREEGTERYEFEAVKRGKATITMTRVSGAERSITGIPRRETELSFVVDVD